MKANMDLRAYALRNRVYMWEIAQEMKMGDNTFYKYLRTERSEQEKSEFRAIVDRLAQEGK